MVEKDLAWLDVNIFRLRVGESMSQDGLLEKLRALNYHEVKMVEEPAEFAVRGGLIDIYPLSYRAPIRVHFHLDQVASIRDYSLHEGKSLTTFEELFILPVSEAFLKRRARLKAHLEEFEPVTQLEDIRVGDYVVHLEYGIGKFLGTKTLRISGGSKRHLAIEYADQEILYLPFDQHQLLERYLGLEGKRPRLTRLQSKEWARIKERTRIAVKGVAREMVRLQARRNVLPGFQFPPDTDLQLEFERSFPYEETADQRRATEEVKRDMERLKPMDRLLCGDVGYGKTEVAVRAAFKAVLVGKQVAFLVPTTLLAEQHYLTLKRRMKDAPIRVDLLSRYRDRKDQGKVVEQIKEGKVDVIVGTHRLLSRDVGFKDLGLAVIDEEQRFGVRHKEKLKFLRESVDVLTLTATPIPRTLYLSLLGVRDMSVIETPPKQRLPIITEILEFDDHRIQEAIERELARKGQVYFVHNRVESIEKIHTYLKKLMPQVSFGVAHGQMPVAGLEKVMNQFIDGKVDCLISTNIIESGIDIPNVNTIIVNRADTFGLADLYQLRGRVGRFHTARQAYAYFLVPRDWVMTQDAEKRLAAIERFSELGAGLKVALEDLEIRGAGNVVGHEQSGFICQVGFDLYCRMLREAVNEEKKEIQEAGLKR
ncbi:MAG: transcription-repair coupling factor [Candidatus Omnitrophica bacterium]|nr:transcription-repair coupling factor [Candidatus Omnitrophota bacterium]